MLKYCSGRSLKTKALLLVARCAFSVQVCSGLPVDWPGSALRVEMLSDLPVAAAVAWCAEALTQSACLLIDSDHIQV